MEIEDVVFFTIIGIFGLYAYNLFVQKEFSGLLLGLLLMGGIVNYIIS